MQEIKTGHPVAEEDESKVSLSDFLEEYGDVLAQKIIKNVSPIHNPLDPVGVEHFDNRLTLLQRPPYPSQGEVIKALSKGFYDENHNSLILCGEMGTGKTLLATATAFASPYPQRSIIMCPPHLVKKWMREIQITVPGAKIFDLSGKDCLKKLLKIRDDEQRNKKPVTHEFYVISRERAKASYMWKGAYVVRGSTTQCPKCGCEITEKREGDEIFSVTPAQLDRKKHTCHNITGYRVYEKDENGNEKVIYRRVPLKWLEINGKDSSYNLDEIKCNEPLWVANNKKLRRYAPCEFIKKYLNGYFDMAIFDEIHELKSGHSNQGHAFGCIGSSVKKILGLTGTLMGGYADDLYYILYRIAPELMKKYNFNYGDSMQFMHRYGIIEEITYLNDGEDNRTGRGKKGNKIVKRKPGIAPTVLPYFLLDKTVFIKLADVAEGLPPYSEDVISVGMDDEQGRLYKNLEKDFKDLIAYIKRKEKTIPMGIVSQMIQSLLSYPDSCIVRGEDVTRKVKDNEGKIQLVTNLITAPKMEEQKFLPKEEKLLELVESELKQTRRVLIYASFTGTRDITPRIKHVLGRKGINAEILRSTVAPGQREGWINNKVKEGVNVLICNPELVKTGLDLIDFPTIIFYQTGYRIDTLRQASRRSWRIGQRVPVKVFFLNYKNTMQSAALALIAQKLDTALMVEGDLVDGGLAALSNSTDSLVADLVKNMMTGKSGGFGLSAENAWKKFKTKESMAENVLAAVSTETAAIKKVIKQNRDDNRVVKINFNEFKDAVQLRLF